MQKSDSLEDCSGAEKIVNSLHISKNEKRTKSKKSKSKLSKLIEEDIDSADNIENDKCDIKIKNLNMLSEMGNRNNLHYLINLMLNLRKSILEG